MPILPRIIATECFAIRRGDAGIAPYSLRKAFFYSSSSLQLSARFFSVAVFSWER